MRRHAITLGFLALGSLLPAQYQSADTLFITQARQALVWDADQPGLEALMNATEALAPSLDDDDRRALTEAAREALGEPPTARVMGLLQENAEALAQAAQAAAAAPFDPYPMTSSYSASITSQGQLRVPPGRSDRFTPTDLSNLLLADAQRAAAADDYATAAERITQAMRISHSLTTHLRDPNLWGLQARSLIESLRLAGELAADGELSPETLQGLRQEVEALDLDEATAGDVIGELVESRKRVIRQAEIDPGMRNRLRISLNAMQAGPQMEEVELDLFRGSQSFNEEIDHLVDVLDEPAGEWGPAVRIYEGQPTFRQGLVQVAVLLNIARARAAIAEIMIALAQGEQPPTLEDPFSGGPIQVTETRVYSVGPDGVNDGGLVAHRLNQDRRLFTGGDIITTR